VLPARHGVTRAWKVFAIRRAGEVTSGASGLLSTIRENVRLFRGRSGLKGENEWKLSALGSRILTQAERFSEGEES